MNNETYFFLGFTIALAMGAGITASFFLLALALGVSIGNFLQLYLYPVERFPLG